MASSGSGNRESRTNSATNFALPLSESLCTLDVSFFSLFGFSEVAMLIVSEGSVTKSVHLICKLVVAEWRLVEWCKVLVIN